MNFIAAGNPVAGCPPTCNVLPYPNVQWGGYTYNPWSYNDNRFAFGVSAYDSQGNYVNNVQVLGDRYIGSITVNAGPQTITFFGQGGSALDVTERDEFVSQRLGTSTSVGYLVCDRSNADAGNVAKPLYFAEASIPGCMSPGVSSSA